MEKLSDKAYAVMMPFRGELRPRVQNYRNLWKVGHVIEGKEEAVELDNFIKQEWSKMGEHHSSEKRI